MSRGLPRVLVLTGTSEHGFGRLLGALPALVSGGAASEVRVQGRHAPPVAPGVVALGMVPRDAVAREVAGADVVVSHGGSGSCADAMRAGHRPIVVPRRAALGEHVDDHQADLAAELARLGLAVVAEDPLEASLPALVRAAARAGRGTAHRLAPLGSALRDIADDVLRRRAGPFRARARRVSATRYADAFRAAPRRHPLQSPAWGEARRIDGWSPSWWVAFGRSGRPVACAQALRRSPAVLPAYLPYGPVLADEPDSIEATRILLDRLAASSPGGLVWAPPADGRLAHHLDGPRVRVLAKPSKTGLVALDTDEAMMKRMRATWRQELRYALADPGLSVRWDDPTELTPALLRRVHELAREKGFQAPVSPDVGRAFAAGAAASGLHALACSAVRGDRVLDRWLAVVAGERALTLWNAHEDVEGERNAGRLVVWSLLRRARDLGASVYDVTGIDDEGNPGVASFKRGLGPELVEVPGLRWVAPPRLPRAAIDPLAAVARRARPGA
jgi:UDP-N-acetylglucosamine transferase subunit ALG13